MKAKLQEMASAHIRDRYEQMEAEIAANNEQGNNEDASQSEQPAEQAQSSEAQEAGLEHAYDFLMKNKSGDLLGVFHREDIGDIDLVWGNRDGGLAHMIRRHLEEQNDFVDVAELCDVIDNVIKHGIIVRENADKMNIEYDGYRVSIRKTIRDKEGNIVSNKNWIVTAFDKSKPKHEKRRKSSSETLSTPSTNREADGVTLPSNDIPSTDKGTESPSPVQANEEENNTEEARKQRLASVNTNVFPESYDLYGVKSTLYDYQNGLATYVDAEGKPCIFLAANETGSAYVGVFRDASGRWIPSLRTTLATRACSSTW